MYLISVLAITEPLSWFLEIQTTILTLMFGRLAVSLQNSCLANLFSRERVVSINWSKSLKFWELPVKKKSLQWILTTTNIASLRSDPFLGTRFSVTVLPKKQSILFQHFSYMTHFPDPLLLVPFLIRSLMNYVTRTLYYPTVNPCLHYSTSPPRNVNKNQKSSRRSSPIGTKV